MTLQNSSDSSTTLVEMGEDYEICVKEMRAFFEKPKKLGMLPRMVKVRKEGERDPLQRKASTSSTFSIGSITSSSGAGSISSGLDSPPPTLIDAPLDIPCKTINEPRGTVALIAEKLNGGVRERRKSYQGSECSNDEFSGSSSTSGAVSAASDDASSAASDDDHSHDSEQTMAAKNVVQCYKGPYIEQDEEREVLCNINNAFLTKKKLTQAENMLKLLKTAEKGILANQAAFEKRVEEEEEADEEQEKENTSEAAKLQTNLDEVRQMIEKTEAIVDHYTRKFRDFSEAGDTKGIEAFFK